MKARRFISLSPTANKQRDIMISPRPERPGVSSTRQPGMISWWQPEIESQLSAVHTSRSSQSSAEPDAQAPPLHASFSVQVSPSLQGSVLGVKTQPLPELQESSVQRLESSQPSAPPPWQVPPPHASFSVQASPSSQGSVLGVKTQPLTELQDSSVHRLE